MYNENNNNEQNNGYTNNGHPQEYYYSTGSQNYQNNSTPARKPKKQHPGSIFCLPGCTVWSHSRYSIQRTYLYDK